MILKWGIFTAEEMETMTSAMSRAAIVLIGARMVCENIVEVLDRRPSGIRNVEGP